MASRIIPKTGAQLPRDRRRAMTPARKRRIWLARGGLCGVCHDPVPEAGPGVVYDHIGTLWITGSDADEDIWPIHADPCDANKTPGDLSRIAKTKRQAKMMGPRKAPKRPMCGRPFGKQHRPMAKRVNPWRKP